MALCFVLNGEFHDGSLLSHHVITACSLASYAMCIVNWVSCGNRMLSLYNLFVLYMLLSNLGESILYMFGFPEELMLVYVKASLEQVNAMLRFQLLCAAGMNLGTMLYIYKAKHCISMQAQREAYKQSEPLTVGEYTILDVLLFISMAYVVLFSIRMFLLRQVVDYETFYHTRQGWTTFIGQILNFLSVTLSLWFLFKKRYIFTIYLFLIWCVSIYMLIGARSLSISYFCILIVMLPLTHSGFFRKRYAIVWMIAAFVGFAVLSIISNYRTAAIGTISFGSDLPIWVSALDTISEMGMSASTSIMTMEEVARGFPLHQTILTTIINAFVPFISDLPFMQEEFMHLSKWATDLAGSDGSGYGFCCIAEAYINYGNLGWIFFIVYGLFIAYAENTAYRRIMRGSYPYAIFLLTFLARQIFFARGELGLSSGTLRFCVYAAIIIWFWQMIKRSRETVKWEKQ